MLLELLRDPLFRSGLMVIWLLPCAIQDLRTRRVSNWLTIPLFLIAWPVAIVTDNFPLTFAVFVGVFVATKLEPRFGGADAKLMVSLAAFAPLGLAIAVILEGLVLLLLRLRWRTAAVIAGASWLYLGAALNAVILLVVESQWRSS